MIEVNGSEWINQLINGTNPAQYCLWQFLAMALFLIHMERRNRIWTRIAGGLSILLAYYVASSFFFRGPSESWMVVWFVLTFLVNAGIGKLICKISWREAIYCSINGVLTEHLASSIYIYLFTRDGALEWSGIQYYIINLLVYAVVYVVIARRLTHDGHYKVGIGVVSTTVIAGLGVTVWLSMQLKSSVDATSSRVIIDPSMNHLFQLCQIYAISFCVLMLVLQVFNRRDIEAQRKSAINQILWQQRQEQYKLSRDNIDLINRKCHDMKHQIAALLQTGGTNPSKDKFIKEIQDMVEVYDTNVDTGNEALDVILTQKGLYCKMHEIQWTCIADGTILQFMDQMDLYTLLGNAIDNAIESAEKIDNPNRRIVQVQIRKQDHFVLIQVENSFDGELVMKDGLPVTTKADKKNHGYGVSSIRSIATKYQGNISIKAEDHAFILNVLIPVPKMEKTV